MLSYNQEHLIKQLKETHKKARDLEITEVVERLRLMETYHPGNKGVQNDLQAVKEEVMELELYLFVTFEKRLQSIIDKLETL